MAKLRHRVFWPSLLLLGMGLAYSLLGGAAAVKLLNATARALTHQLSGPLAGTALGALLLCLVVAVSPLGGVRLGGPDAERELTPWQYFSIALCTTVAVGILFWATAEPLYHYQAPPESLGIQAQSRQASVFAMSTLLQHWTLIPYSLYAVPAVLFALVFYNLKRPFRLSSCLYPLLGEHSDGRIGDLVDSVCLFALVAGMAASLGAGILTLAGGLQHIFGLPSKPFVWVMVGLTVVASFVVSAVSGLDQGIRRLSDLNAKVFFALMLFICVWGPAGGRLGLTIYGLGDYFLHLVPRGLLWEFDAGDKWPLDWTLFYWTNWLAWAPVTALFLGRISKGYTVRQMLMFTLALPSLFVTFWMGILGGSALVLEDSQHQLLGRLEEMGPESIIYAILETMPAGLMLAGIFVFGVFVSYVTAADSNTLAMAGLCWSGVSTEDPDPPAHLKILWGCIVGGLSVVMICSAGIDGVKALSNLGGVPALLLELAAAASLTMLLFRWPQFELTARRVQDQVKDGASPEE